MGINLDITQLFSPATQPEWLATLLSNANTLGLSTTSWQAGAPERTILAILSYALNFEDSTTSLLAQAGFLDFASTGTVTYTTPNADGTSTSITVPVTPDPSKPSENPTGAAGWLDVLADSSYDVQRVWATYAGGPMAITNTSVSTYGSFAAGAYHVSDPSNNATYSNTAALSIPPSTLVVGVAGVTSAGGVIKIQTSSGHGLSTGAVVSLVGVTGIPPLAATRAFYIDVVDSTHFTLRGSTFAGSYTGGGDVYTPTVAPFIADAVGSGGSSLNAEGAVDVHTVTQPVTSLVGVAVDNLTAFVGSDTEPNTALAARCRLKLQSLSIDGPAGAYKFAALSASTLALKLNPAQTLSQTITRCETFADNLTGTVRVWIATATGAPTDGDVSIVNLVEQAFATPLGVTSVTAKATEVPVTAVAQVYVPAALNTTATQALFQAAVQAYFRTLKIGGESDPNGDYTHVVPFDAVLGAIFEAGELGGVPVPQATLHLNGSTANIPLVFSAAEADVAVLSPALPTITLHSV
jgi:hypothetical protein